MHLIVIVIFSVDPRQTAPSRHVRRISSPQLFLFCILTNCDARNLPRFGSYAICASRTVLRDETPWWVQLPILELIPFP